MKSYKSKRRDSSSGEATKKGWEKKYLQVLPPPRGIDNTSSLVQPSDEDQAGSDIRFMLTSGAYEDPIL
jgi:hypothetical protein